jgi:hypothetical protein
MHNFTFSKYYDTNDVNDNKNDDDDDDDDDITEDNTDDDNDDDEIKCKNIDPALARLMGILIEEQKEEQNTKIDWKPPSKSGLDNSNPIISSNYFYNQPALSYLDFFKIIKDDILQYKKLTDKQLEYIKNLNNQEKFELIEIYNSVLESSIKK